ncbi:MAG: hypothetical protein A2289_19255 [Deltaproteobacteria bacterium RIFOXYA12_FULL_58_15]|nr:MAG: hypothetical protein A2289_19255 [Deltaproteobacteria bacterium RIFOXYA12_FULL_58_15]
MRRKSFIVVILLATGCAALVHQGRSQQTELSTPAPSAVGRLFVPAPPGAAKYGQRENEKDGQTPAIEMILAQLGNDAPTWDSRLAAAVSDLAAFVSREPLAYGTIEFALHHHGIVEPTPHLLVMFTTRSDDVALAQVVAERLRDIIATSTYQWLGIGVADRQGSERVVIAAMQVSHLTLDPVPRSVPQGARVRLRGQVHVPYADPVVFVTRDSGEVVEVPVKRWGKGGFTAELSCDGDAIRLEVSAAANEGATVLANFPIYCGRVPPRQLQTQTVGAGDLGDLDAQESRLIGLINAERLRAGLSELQVDADVAAVARSYSEEMVRTGKVVHVSAISGAAYDRLKRAGIVRPLVQENLARSSSVDEAHRSLMNSPGHRANILSAQATHVGVGVVSASDGVADDLLVTELFTLSPPRLDLAKAQQQLGKRLRAARRLRADEALDRIAQKGAQEIAKRGAAEAKLLQDPDMLKPVAGRYKGIRAMVVAVGDLSQIGPERVAADTTITHLGVGVAQGSHPDLGPGAIFVVLLLGVGI